MKSLIYGTFLTVITLFAVSCSNNDDNDDNTDPSGTIALNLYNESNGKTMLGNSDVYIDKANNFYGPSCLIANLGKKKGLGSMSDPVLDGVSIRVAVEQGSGYNVFKNAATYEFPSGTLALNITADYYNVYVASQIKQNDVVVGANVKFVLMDVPKYGLPEYNKLIGTLDHLDGNEMELSIDLPSSDFEYETAFGSSDYYTLEHEKVGNKIVVRLIDYRLDDIFGFYIRIKNSYTYVYGYVR